jgi:hypothetical protein
MPVFAWDAQNALSLHHAEPTMWQDTGLRRKTKKKGKKNKRRVVSSRRTGECRKQANKIRSTDYGVSERRKNERAKTRRRVCRRSCCCCALGEARNTRPLGRCC